MGKRVDRDLTIAIKNTVNSYENVYGAFDLILNDYGPDTYLGSIHIEVPDTMTAAEIDELTRNISKKVYKTISISGIVMLNKYFCWLFVAINRGQIIAVRYRISKYSL